MYKKEDSERRYNRKIKKLEETKKKDNDTDRDSSSDSSNKYSKEVLKVSNQIKHNNDARGGHLTTCQQGRLPAVEKQGDLISIDTYQRSSEHNTSIEPTALDTTTENLGDSYKIISESESNSACRPKRRRENEKKPRKTERDSSSDSSYKSSKENFKIPEKPRQKKNEVESKNDKKIKKLEEAKKRINK